jgi:hypothetical protein
MDLRGLTLMTMIGGTVGLLFRLVVRLGWEVFKVLERFERRR